MGSGGAAPEEARLVGDYQNPDYSLLGDNHVSAYRESDGEVGYVWNGAPTLLLTTPRPLTLRAPR